MNTVTFCITSWSSNSATFPIVTQGHPYMEVQRLNTKTPEKLADWLLDASLCVTKLHQEFLVRVPVAVPAIEWNKTLDAE